MHKQTLLLPLLLLSSYATTSQANPLNQGNQAYDQYNYDQANHYYQQACINGDQIACTNLATLTDRGLTTTKKTQAATLYQNACQQGDPIACKAHKQRTKNPQSKAKITCTSPSSQSHIAINLTPNQDPSKICIDQAYALRTKTPNKLTN